MKNPNEINEKEQIEYIKKEWCNIMNIYHPSQNVLNAAVEIYFNNLLKSNKSFFKIKKPTLYLKDCLPLSNFIKIKKPKIKYFLKWID